MISEKLTWPQSVACWLTIKIVVLSLFLNGYLLAVQELPERSMPERLSDRVIVQSEKNQHGKIQFGKFLVYEDREKQTGRILELNFTILRADGDPRPDPVFVLAGGPGVDASGSWRQYADSWQREERDVVLLGQRGTSGSNRLRIRWPERNDPQALINPVFNADFIRQQMQLLEKNADLTMYSTPTAMDDLNDFRIALGYEKINITGGSYGTRAALVYLRRHGETVRTAILNGVAPLEFRNPLYHAREAQRALELLFKEVESNETYSKAFPGLRQKFDAILKRL